jgi:hypothetical protein
MGLSVVLHTRVGVASTTLGRGLEMMTHTDLGLSRQAKSPVPDPATIPTRWGTAASPSQGRCSKEWWRPPHPRVYAFNPRVYAFSRGQSDARSTADRTRHTFTTVVALVYTARQPSPGTPPVGAGSLVAVPAGLQNQHDDLSHRLQHDGRPLENSRSARAMAASADLRRR